MRTVRFSIVSGVVLAAVLISGGCWSDPWDCSGENAEECEAARHLVFWASLPRGNSGGGTSGGSGGGGATGSGESTASTCATSPAAATPIAYVRVGEAPAGKSCFYRFEIVYEPGNTGPFRPDFQLVSETGNVDLYLGFDNDATGGTTAFTGCSAQNSGGGWVRCSRNLGNADDFVSTKSESIPAMNPGDFRIVSVYNPGTSAVDFALLAYKQGGD